MTKKMRNSYRTLIAAILACALLTVGYAQQAQQQEQQADADPDEVAIDMEEVPTDVRFAAMAVAASYGLEITSVRVEMQEGGTLSYEFDGEGFGFDVAPDATLTELEMVVPSEDVPQEVRDTLQRFLPELEAETVERTIRPNEPEAYAFSGRLGGQEVEVEIIPEEQDLIINYD